MQAIILAAGFGGRLRPLTDSMPKCLTEVNGIPMLLNTLGILDKCGISETIIVVGHMREKIVDTIGFQLNNMRITYVENTVYRETNNVYSFFLTNQYIHDDVLLIECDLFFREKLIRDVMAGDADCNIMVSPFNPDTMNGTVVRVEPDQSVTSLVIGKRQHEGFDYSSMMKTVNVYKFKSDFIISMLMPAVELYVRTQQVKSYYELVLGSLIYFGNASFHAVVIDETEWAEIDDMDDLRRAEAKFL